MLLVGSNNCLEKKGCYFNVVKIFVKVVVIVVVVIVAAAAEDSDALMI